MFIYYNLFFFLSIVVDKVVLKVLLDEFDGHLLFLLKHSILQDL